MRNIQFEYGAYLKRASLESVKHHLTLEPNCKSEETAHSPSC